jgi:hypothetical protein
VNDFVGLVVGLMMMRGIQMGLLQWIRDVRNAFDVDDIWDQMDEEDGPDQHLTPR